MPVLILKMQEVVDGNDKKLTELREEFGEEAHKAVVGVLLDPKECSPCVGYSAPELWNFEKGRRASLKEVIQHIILTCEIHKKKDAEQTAAIIELSEEKERLSKRLERVSILMDERDELLIEKGRTISKLMSQDVQKDKMLSIVSASATTSTRGKNVLETCNTGRKQNQCMHNQTEKFKHDLGKRTVTIKREMDCMLEATADQLQSPAKKLKDSKVDNIAMQKGAKSQDNANVPTIYHTMLQGQMVGENNKALKDEPDVLFGTDVSSSSYQMMRARRFPLICG